MQDDIAKRLADFQWGDDDEPLEENLPEFKLSEEDVEVCANTIAETICKNLSIDSFDPTNLQGTILSVTIDISLHKALEFRYSKKWNLESRIRAFKKIGDKLEQILLSENKEILDRKINDILPLFCRKKFVIDGVYLHDDALIMGGESDVVFSVELPLNFVECEI